MKSCSGRFVFFRVGKIKHGRIYIIITRNEDGVCMCVCVQNYFQFRDPLDSVLELRAALDFETLPNLTITVVATVRLGTHE